MIDSLRDALAPIEERQKTIEVFAPSADLADDVAAQFASKNVSVTHRPRPTDADRSFLVVRSAAGEFLGALALETFEAMLSPEIHPPWEFAERETDHASVFDFLDDTLFRSYDRRQMLATAREIEERAWRVGTGRLSAGFQRFEAFRKQISVYERLAEDGQLSIDLFVSDEWTESEDTDLSVVTDTAEEIGSFWFVVFDGGGSPLDACALVAEERDPGQYYGFWTNDPAMVEELMTYLDERYATG